MIDRRPGGCTTFKEGKDHKFYLRFPALADKELALDKLTDADEALLQAFTQRVRERGIAFDASPVLRTITGGAGTA